LLSLPLFLNLDQFLSLAPALGHTLSAKFLLSVLLLIIPTTCMGATFPLVALIAIRHSHAVGNQISQLYGYNTVGAVAGALLSGFFLIPRIGLDGAILTAAACNFIVALLALTIASPVAAAPAKSPDLGQGPVTATAFSGRAVRLATITLATTGFGSIAAQVGWTKYLSIFTGSTVYGFSAILGIFLSGVALGSLAVRSRADRIKSAESFMAMLILLLAFTMLVTRWGLGMLPALQAQLNALEAPAHVDALVRYAAVIAIVLPPTLLLGAIFPLNLKIYCGSSGVSRIGRAYAINTFAGIFGALLAGFVVIPYLGTDKLLVIVTILVSILAALWLTVIDRTAGKIKLAAGAISVVVLATVTPGIDFRKLISTVGYDEQSKSGVTPEFLFLEEGKAGVISLVTFNDRLARLQNNGLNESSLHLRDKSVSPRTEFLLGIVPQLLVEDPKNALVIGFGGGHTARALMLTDIEKIEVVELEPAVIRANLAIDGFAKSLLEDARLQLTINDARNHLLLNPARYDLIVSQPSHPWLAGASALFTREFWKIVGSRLSDQGVFAQWINLFSMEPDVLRSLLITFYSEFEYGFVLADTENGDLIAIGSRSPVVIDPKRFNRALSQRDVLAIGAGNGVTSVKDVLQFFAFSRDQALVAAQGAVLNTDTNLFSEVSLAIGYRASDVTEPVENFIMDNRRFDVFPYLAPGREELVVDLVNYFLVQDDPETAWYIAQALPKGDNQAADHAVYRSLFQMSKASDAFAVFNARSDWGDDWLSEHIGNMVALGMSDSANKYVANIADLRLRREIEDKLLFAAGRIEDLLKRTDPEASPSIWQIIALSHADLERSYELLRLQNEIPADAKLDVLLVEMRHHAAKNRKGELAKTAQSLVSLIRAEITRLERVRSNISSESAPGLAELVERRISQLTSYIQISD
jgi:spermidine synthase